MLYGRDRKTAIFRKIAKRRLCIGIFIKKTSVEELRRIHVHLEKALSVVTRSIYSPIVIVTDDRNARSVCKKFNGVGVIEVFSLSNKGYRVAARAATKAVKAAVLRIYGKGGCLLAMERTESLHIRACALQ